jgi:hypothetical protein
VASFSSQLEQCALNTQFAVALFPKAYLRLEAPSNSDSRLQHPALLQSRPSLPTGKEFPGLGKAKQNHQHNHANGL